MGYVKGHRAKITPGDLRLPHQAAPGTPQEYGGARWRPPQSDQILSLKRSSDFLTRFLRMTLRILFVATSFAKC
jgi:hypothetical protein